MDGLPSVGDLEELSICEGDMSIVQFEEKKPERSLRRELYCAIL